MKEHSVWNEKYRPQVIEDLVCDDKIKQIFNDYINSNDIINLLFHGSAGSGKTTTAKILAKSINCDFIIINASDERGIDTVRDKIVGFASTASFKPLKIIVLDEFDYATPQMQASLRNVIETYSRTTRFIFTCNYLEKVIEPIQSRCQVIKLVPPTKKDFALHLLKILDCESVKYDKKDIVPFVNSNYPDFRKAINNIQIASTTKVLKTDINNTQQIWLDDIISELKNNNTNWKSIRQIILDNCSSNYEDIFKKLYDCVDDYSNGNTADIIITLEEHIFHSSFVVDKEINVMACILKIIKIKNNKTII